VTHVEALAGELDIAVVDELIARVDQLHQDGVRDVTFDMAGVTFCNGRGFAVLVHAYRLGMHVTVRRMRPHIRRHLTVMGLESFATVD